MNSPMRMRVFNKLAWMVLKAGAKRATKYLSPTEVVKATFQGKRDGRNRYDTVIFTVGAPNYAERKFIQLAQQAGETFPIKKIQIQQDRN